MKSFDWKTKFTNKVWVLAFIAALFVVISAILSAFGITIDLASIQGKIVAIVEAIFSLLAVMGVVINPNTPGVSDIPVTIKTKDE